jgi:hypothetical protein
VGRPALTINRGLRRVDQPVSLLTRAPEDMLVTAARYVTLSGYSPDAVHKKMQRGQWLENREYVRAPDGRILVDLLGYGAWARGTA